MRIAVYHNLPSGGGKRALYEQVRRLSRDNEIDVFSLSCSNHEFCDLRPYVHAHHVLPFEAGRLYRRPIGRLNQGVRALDLLRLERQQRALAADIDAASYDVVYAANCQFAAAPPLLRFLRTPSAYYCQEPPRQLYEPVVGRLNTGLTAVQSAFNLLDPLPAGYRRTLRRIDRDAAMAASRVLCNSHYSRETLYRTYGLYADVTYLGVDPDLFQPLDLPREDYCLSVGGLNTRKGFDFLLHSLARIDASARPPLIVVSNTEQPAERAFLQELANEGRVSLEIRTMISDDELVTLYNRAALVLYAPIMEPFGFVPLESMACGTPVVGVREAGVRESVVDGVTGVLTERDPDAFAHAIQTVMNDQSLLSRLTHACRPHVMEHWSWERSVTRLEASLRAVVSTGIPA